MPRLAHCRLTKDFIFPCTLKKKKCLIVIQFAFKPKKGSVTLNANYQMVPMASEKQDCVHHAVI